MPKFLQSLRQVDFDAAMDIAPTIVVLLGNFRFLAGLTIRSALRRERIDLP